LNTITSVQTESREVNQLQRNIQQAVRPILQNPLVYGNQLTSVSLVNGSNTVSHGLGRELQGWSISRKRANANIYDTQDSNPSPTKTLLLTSDASVVVDLYVW
jgi:hypothetical protein